MKLTQIADGDCGRDDCAGIFATDRNTVVIDRAVPFVAYRMNLDA